MFYSKTLTILTFLCILICLSYSQSTSSDFALMGNVNMSWPEAEDDYIWSINKIWVLVCGSMIFSMQVGFAFLESGSIRKKNHTVCFYRIMIHSLVSVLAFWLIGYALCYSDAYSNFIGGKTFYGGVQWDTPNAATGEVTQYAYWILNYAVAVVVVDICNGSISERTSLVATSIHAFFVVLFIYPVVVAWSWGGGWLHEQGYLDYSGSGVVHTTGAFSGLAGLILVGPRYNRWNKFNTELAEQKEDEKEPTKFTNSQGESKKIITRQSLIQLRNKVNEEDYEYFGVTNLIYTLFGGIFLWVGFVFYNAGTTFGMLKIVNGDPTSLWYIAEVAAINTFLSGCSAGLFALIVKTPLMNGFGATRKLRDEAGGVCNAFLAGMVACGGGMDQYTPWAAFVVGLIGSIFYCLLCKLFDILKIDDAVEAIQLHGGGGASGVMCTAFLHIEKGILYGNPTQGKIFGIQLMGWVVIAAWSFTCSFVIFGLLKAIGLLRTDLKTEAIGYDFVEFADGIDFSSLTFKKSNLHERVASHMKKETINQGEQFIINDNEWLC